MTKEMKKYLSIEEAAALCKVHENSIRNWIEEGILEAQKITYKGRKRWLILLTDIPTFYREYEQSK